MSSNFLEGFNEEDTREGIESLESEIEEDTSYLEKEKKKKKTFIITGIIVLVIIILFYIFSQIVKVPEFVNNLSSIATKWGKENGVTIKDNYVFDSNILEGVVINQSIKQGKRIFKNKEIVITISKGADPNEIVVVPDLKTSTASQIKEWKENNNLKYVTIKEISSNTIPKGNIISYEFESVTISVDNFTRSDKLTVVVSKGSDAILMEDFSSASKDEVRSWCDKKEVKCEFAEKFSTVIEPNMIISQSIEAGTTLAKGVEITFVVSLGESITVPNYSNVSSNDATEYSDKIKVKIKNIYSMKVGYGKLISQSIKAGTQISSRDNEITLTYSIGIPYFKSLLGESESELAKIFYEYNQKGVNLSYEVKYVDSDSEKGNIVWSSKANEFVSMKEHIEIHVSNGSLYNSSSNEEDVNDN